MFAYVAKSVLAGVAGVFAFGMATGLAQSSSPISLERELQETAQQFMEAIADRRGTKASELVTTDVINTFASLRRLALDGTIDQVKAEHAGFPFLPFRARALFQISDLGEEPREFFERCVDSGLIFRNRWAKQIRPGHLLPGTKTDAAAALSIYRGAQQRPDLGFTFIRQDNSWRLTLEAIHVLGFLDLILHEWVVPLSEEEKLLFLAERERVRPFLYRYIAPQGPGTRQDQRTFEDFVREYFEEYLGAPFDPRVLEPMTKSKAR